MSGSDFDTDEEEERIDLEALSKDPHPCLAVGQFSIFNSPRVQPANLQDVTYTLDMDGVVVLSK